MKERQEFFFGRLTPAKRKRLRDFLRKNWQNLSDFALHKLCKQLENQDQKDFS